MPFPGTEEWRAIADNFQKLWNFPNCVGAIDRKHVTIQAPGNSGSQFHNYKGSFSVVLLGVVDARYRFRMIDVGAYGKSSDGGTLSSSAFGQALRHDALDVPSDAPLPGAGVATPFVFVGDEGFPLRRNMMRPFPGHNLPPEQRIFNYCPSQPGEWLSVPSAYWLHSGDYPSSTALCTEPSAGMQGITQVGSNNASREALAVRKKFATYFSSSAVVCRTGVSIALGALGEGRAGVLSDSDTLVVGGIADRCGVSNVEESDVSTREKVGLEVKCGEVKMRITVKRQFFTDRHIPYEPEYLRLGANATRLSSCGPKTPKSASEMVISARLQDCGTESSVHGEWLVFSNQLVLFPAVVPTSTGSVIVRGIRTLIPVECHYKRKQTVNGEPLTPTWLPMTSTISAFGLLHFYLLTMADDCSSQRSSSVYQQGEAVFLEAGVEAPLHAPLTLHVDYCVATLKPDPLSLPSYKFIIKHGCLMDSILPGSASKFLPRKQNNRLCFSVQALRFHKESGEQIFISCHLRATLKQNSHSNIDKACFFHRPTFRWRSTEGDNSLCECCGSDNCFRRAEEENSGIAGHRTQPDTERSLEADTTVGPLHTLPRSHWTGHLSVSH
uniref:zona pellucida sperm-binding protein 3-like n=1 Tax=Semicossyphus pulcher TaxID=241346 RepID=UPI0037E704E4